MYPELYWKVNMYPEIPNLQCSLRDLGKHVAMLRVVSCVEELDEGVVERVKAEAKRFVRWVHVFVVKTSLNVKTLKISNKIILDNLNTLRTSTCYFIRFYIRLYSTLLYSTLPDYVLPICF